MRQKSGATTILVCLVLLAGAVTAATFLWYLPYRARQQRQINEKHAVSVLVEFPVIQGDFRKNDRDGNGIGDYWTSDIAGLHRFGLIDRALAEADASPLIPFTPKPLPKFGYYILALKTDETGKVPDPEKFAICLYPEEPGITGIYMYIYSSHHGRLRTTASRNPPRALPREEELRSWGKWD
jgi:hypothetical protein